MKVYVRKIFPHDVTHEVSVTTSIVMDFFENERNNLVFIGKTSQSKGTVTINAATDPRFGGDYKAILQAEGGIKENDLTFTYKNKNNYIIEIVRPNDERYKNFFEMFGKTTDSRHLVFSLDDEEDLQNENSMNQDAELVWLSPEWFKNEASKYMSKYNIEIVPLFEKFKKQYGIKTLETLSGTDLLDNIFLKGNKNDMCYDLEFNKEYRIFGGIGGGNASKYGLYYNNKINAWSNGYGDDAPKLTEDNAIEIAENIKECIIAMDMLIDETEFNTIDDYKKVYDKIIKVTKNRIIDKVFILKYLYIMHPDKLVCYYSDEWQNKVLNLLNITIDETPRFVKMGQISLFVKKCQIPSIVFDLIIRDNLNTEDISDIRYITGFKSDISRNRIFFGAPGTGKSYKLEQEKDDLLKNGGSYERVTFHPDYSYANFVGTYKPVPKANDKISYEYVPGPFMRTYVEAIKSGRLKTPKPFLLLIEEINRANVAAVFGDIFQLLDRKENASEYPIQTSQDMRTFLANAIDGEDGNPDDYKFIKIPDNMFIWASMNSADQGVFPMDTAFKRRWNFEYIGINSNEEKISEYNITLGEDENKRTLKWNKLRKSINKFLSSPEMKINEDKLIGPFFINEECLSDNNCFIKTFQNKIIMYLYEDAAKQKRNKLFEGAGENIMYSDLCEKFEKLGIYIFNESIVKDCNL